MQPHARRVFGVALVVAVATVVMRVPEPVDAQARIPATARDLCALVAPGTDEDVEPFERGREELRRYGHGAVISCMVMKKNRFAEFVELTVHPTAASACAAVEEKRRAYDEATVLRSPTEPAGLGDKGFKVRDRHDGGYAIGFCRGVFQYQGDVLARATEADVTNLTVRAQQVDARCRGLGGAPASDGLAFTFNTYANNVRPLPPLSSEYQLGISTLTGGGMWRDGRFSGTFTDFDIQKGTGTRRWVTGEITGGTYEGQASASRLKLAVRVMGTSHPNECAVGTTGSLELQDSDARLPNGKDYDYALLGTWSMACGPHVHGWNNQDPGPRTEPPAGGAPEGGQWAIVVLTRK
jgi:hypothetical protein